LIEPQNFTTLCRGWLESDLVAFKGRVVGDARRRRRQSFPPNPNNTGMPNNQNENFRSAKWDTYVTPVWGGWRQQASQLRRRRIEGGIPWKSLRGGEKKGVGRLVNKKTLGPNSGKSRTGLKEGSA